MATEMVGMQPDLSGQFDAVRPDVSYALEAEIDVFTEAIGPLVEDPEFQQAIAEIEKEPDIEVDDDFPDKITNGKYPMGLDAFVRNY